MDNPGPLLRDGVLAVGVGGVGGGEGGDGGGAVTVTDSSESPILSADTKPKPASGRFACPAGKFPTEGAGVAGGGSKSTHENYFSTQDFLPVSVVKSVSTE